MPVIQLQLLGKNYQLSCEEGDEPRIRSLSLKLGERLQTLSQHAIGSSDALLMVMCLLMLQDELNEWEQGPKDLPASEEKTVIQTIDRVSNQLEALAETLSNR